MTVASEANHAIEREGSSAENEKKERRNIKYSLRKEEANNSKQSPAMRHDRQNESVRPCLGFFQIRIPSRRAKKPRAIGFELATPLSRIGINLRPRPARWRQVATLPLQG